jgi:hypothetical protein
MGRERIAWRAGRELTPGCMGSASRRLGRFRLNGQGGTNGTFTALPTPEQPSASGQFRPLQIERWNERFLQLFPRMTAGFLPAPSLGCGQRKPWRDRAHPHAPAGVDGDRFRWRIIPWGQAKVRNMHASSHLSISRILQCGCSYCGRPRCRGESNEPFQPLDVPDEAEHLRHKIGFELHRRPDVAVPRSAVPGCAVVKADVARGAEGDGFFHRQLRDRPHVRRGADAGQRWLREADRGRATAGTGSRRVMAVRREGPHAVSCGS